MQVSGSVSGAVPPPGTRVQIDARRTAISFWEPNTASAELQVEPDLGVGARNGPPPPVGLPRHLSEERLENVAEAALEVEAAHPAGLGPEDALGSVAVVAGAPLGVAQHLVGDGHLLEARFGLGVAVIGVRVQLAGRAR